MMALGLVLKAFTFLRGGGKIFGGHRLSESSRAGVESPKAPIDKRWFAEGA